MVNPGLPRVPKRNATTSLPAVPCLKYAVAHRVHIQCEGEVAQQEGRQHKSEASDRRSYEPNFNHDLQLSHLR